MPKIVSTLSSAVTYSTKVKLPNSQFNYTATVKINGGHGMVNHRGQTLIGTETAVTDEELKICQSDPVFYMHVNGGYITVLYDHKKTGESVAADMAGADGSSPAVLSDYPALKEGDTKVAAVGGEPVRRGRPRKVFSGDDPD